MDIAMVARRSQLGGWLHSGTVAGNLGYTTATQAANVLNGTVLFIVLGRILPVDQFGEIGFALSLGSTAALLANYGFGMQAVREVAQGSQSESAALLQGLSAQALLACLTLAGVWVYAATVRMPADRQLLVLLFTLSRIMHVAQLFIGAVRRGSNDFRVEFAAAWLGTVVLVMFTGVVVLVRPTSMLIGVAHLAASAVGLGLALWLVRDSLRAAFDRLPRLRDVWITLVVGYPFAMQVIFTNLYSQVDALVVERLADMESVGYYQAAIRLGTIPFLVLTVFVTAYYPRVAAAFDRQASRFDPTHARQLLAVTGALGALLGICCACFAGELVGGVYGAKMLAAAPLLSILAAAMPLRFVASTLGMILTASAHQLLVGWSAAVAALANVCLNLWLVPRQGVAGAAWANVITSSLLVLLWSALVLRRRYLCRV
jgi:O-antigen/teichoic acid export membrane protein